MKLQDLHEEKIDAYVKRLVKDLHIKKLGAGAFSTVFQHPSYHNISVKVTLDADPKYIMWLKQAEKYQHNPWFPKIVGIHKVHFHADNISKADVDADTEGLTALEGRHIVFMQKLRPIKDIELKRAAQYICRTLPAEYFATDNERYDIFKLERNRERYQNARRALMKKRKFIFTPYDVYSLDRFDDVFWKTLAQDSTDKNLRELGAVLHRIGADDIHKGNIMMRVGEDGSLHPVITDPVAS